ncbi:MAG: hypothetical protein IPI23_13925 [Bacteroidetes bacterium]|nr:hypothetical protein [Bacteroidota bacterium]
MASGFEQALLAGEGIGSLFLKYGFFFLRIIRKFVVLIPILIPILSNSLLLPKLIVNIEMLMQEKGRDEAKQKPAENNCE